MPEDLISRPIHQLAPLLQKKEISPVELFNEAIEKIHEAATQAEQLHHRHRAGRSKSRDEAESEIRKGHYRGPLHGIPISIKDLSSPRAACRTTAGSKVLAQWIPDSDATAVARLLEAGMVLVGKTHMHEFAYGVTNDNPHFGPARNPWDPTRVPGG